MHGAIINSNTTIGSNCIINTKSLIEHDCLIGHNVHISTGAIINGHTKIGLILLLEVEQYYGTT